MCEYDVERVERRLNSFKLLLMLFMSKGSKIVFVSFTQHCIQSNVTHLTHVERVERNLNSFNCNSCYSCRKGSKVVFVTYIHNIDTFTAMSKGSKDYVMLKQGTYTFLHILS